MNMHTRGPGRPASLPPRRVIEAQIEALIDILDTLEPDPDLEPDADGEPSIGIYAGAIDMEAEDEDNVSLGSTHHVNQVVAWTAGPTGKGWIFTDGEPTLGWTDAEAMRGSVNADPAIDDGEPGSDSEPNEDREPENYV